LTHTHVKNHMTFISKIQITQSKTTSKTKTITKTEGKTDHRTHDVVELEPTLAASVPMSDGFCFSQDNCSRFLKTSDSVVTCSTNCGRAAQGTAFLQPQLLQGHRYRIVVRVDQKPGRMCYFFGITRRKFSTDAGQKQIRERSFSLENLYSNLHEERSATQRGKPCFHTGSVVTILVDLVRGTITFSVDSTGIERSAKLPKDSNWQFFVSLYNRGASFTLLEALVF